MKYPTLQSSQPIPKSAHKVFTGYLFSVWQWSQPLYDGTKAIFEKIRHQPSVAILPITAKGNIILSHQEQPGRGRFIASLGGIVEPGEAILTAAKRELLEESGYAASHWHLISAMYVGDKIDWPVYVFTVKQLRRHHKPSLDAGERISLVEYSYTEFLRVITSPNFRDSEISLEILRRLHTIQGKKRLERLFRP